MRPGRGGKISDYYLLLRNTETGEELSHFAEGYGLASAYVHDDVFYAFASRWEEDAWNDIPLFCCSDLIHWEGRKVVEQEGGEHLFNSSVCSGPDGFVMAYESNDPTYPAFTTKFVRSNDLQNWQKIPEAIFGTNRYTANPCIRCAVIPVASCPSFHHPINPLRPVAPMRFLTRLSAVPVSFRHRIW